MAASLTELQQKVVDGQTQLSETQKKLEAESDARNDAVHKLEIQARTIYDLHHAVDAVRGKRICVFVFAESFR